MPQHDPEWIDIIEENLALRRAASEKERAWQARNQRLDQESPYRRVREQQAPTPPAAKASPSDQPVTNPNDMPTSSAPVKPSADTTSHHSPHVLPLDAPRTHEEIIEKNTNYVFIFGYTGSGKSTVLTAINMYMRQHYRVILNQSGNQTGIRLIHQMMRDVEGGHFPQPTSIGQITEYDTAFRMNGEDVNLTFLEMAGEDLRKVDVDTGQEGFPETVQAYLNCPDISISFLIVADYDRVVSRQEDKLILQFLSYLYNEGIDLSRVGVILSKFDRGRTDMDVEEVIQTYLPQVDKWLTSGDIAQPRVFPFSIGDIESQPEQKDQISEIDLDDCSEVVPWLHEVLSLPGSQSHREAPAHGARGMVGKLRRMLKF
jgi:energy-coupling factor transporter ATP-binding protein EcfA2